MALLSSALKMGADFVVVAYDRFSDIVFSSRSSRAALTASKPLVRTHILCVHLLSDIRDDLAADLVVVADEQRSVDRPDLLVGDSPTAGPFAGQPAG